MVLIFTLSAVPGDEYPDVDYPHADKIVHVLLYAPLGLFLARARGKAVGRRSVLPFALGLLYAATDEWHQLYVANRSASFTDWLADALGVMVGILLWHNVQDIGVVAALRSEVQED